MLKHIIIIVISVYFQKILIQSSIVNFFKCLILSLFSEITGGYSRFLYINILMPKVWFCRDTTTKKNLTESVCIFEKFVIVSLFLSKKIHLTFKIKKRNENLECFMILKLLSMMTQVLEGILILLRIERIIIYFFFMLH